MRAGHWHMCGRADTGFRRVSGIHLGLSEHLMGILGMPSYPQCTQEEIKAQKPVSYSKLSFLVRLIPAHSSLAPSSPFRDI